MVLPLYHFRSQPTHTLFALSTFVAFTAVASASPQEKRIEIPALKIEIADEPKSIDPAKIVDEKLAQAATVEFKQESLSEAADWIGKQANLPVILDTRSLEAAGILTSEPVEDKLQEEPIYLLLDRLANIDVAWRFADGIVYLHAAEEPIESTQQFSVGDLFDGGHSPRALQQVIENCIDPDSWEVSGGQGGIVMLGDVVFIRQSEFARRRVAGLLEALRKHGKRTFIFDPPQHTELRKALQTTISIRFDEMPLVTAVEQLQELSNADIRLDKNALRRVGIRERMPVSLEIEKQPLRLALDLLQQQYDLAWHIENGILSVTEPAGVDLVTAVFDVRDLCRNRQESEALREAVESQAVQYDWIAGGGSGTIEFPLDGVMVVYQHEKGMDAVLELLENYRAALRASKPREQAETNPVITHYYRMPSNVAKDLVKLLPELLQPATWKSQVQPDAPGTIRIVQSWPEFRSRSKSEKNDGLLVDHSVLVISQKQSVQDEIPELLRRIEDGDSFEKDGMGGMGGFGGGFFRVP